eukprot:3299768-Rhodomonas_salina.3
MGAEGHGDLSVLDAAGPLPTIGDDVVTGTVTRCPDLPRQLTWSDWELYVRCLPHSKAGGEDSVTYELVQEAQLRLQQVILTGVNATGMLAGKALQLHWKGGVIQLLTKRDPNSQIENLCPVTLLQVAKLPTSFSQVWWQTSFPTRWKALACWKTASTASAHTSRLCNQLQSCNT